MSLMRPFLQQPMMQQGLSQGLSEGLSQGLANFGTYQQMMLDMLRQAGSASTNASASSAKGSEAEHHGNTSAKSSAASAKRIVPIKMPVVAVVVRPSRQRRHAPVQAQAHVQHPNAVIHKSVTIYGQR